MAMRVRIGLEGVPLLLPVGERVPFQQIIERLVPVADQHGPEPGLLDAVALPDLQGDGVEPLQQIGQAARHRVIDAQLIDHLIPPELGYFTDENGVGVSNVLVIEATIGPFFSVSARAASHSGSTPNLPIFASRSASDSHFTKSVRSWFDSPPTVFPNPPC